MYAHHVNLLAVLVSAIATMLIGFLWYSPLLFAKPWMREMGYDPADAAKMQEMKKSAGPAYGASFLTSVLTAFILGLFLHWMHIAEAARWVSASASPFTPGLASPPPCNSPARFSRARA
jgi:hypothetical protein